MTIKFFRRNWNRFSRLGMGRKKKQKWRNPTGRHNKIREKIRGHPSPVSIGYRQDKSSRGKILEKKVVRIYNMKDLGKIGKNEIGLLGKIGKRKKTEIAKKAVEMKIHIHGINLNKFAKDMERKRKHETKSGGSK